MDHQIDMALGVFGVPQNDLSRVTQKGYLLEYVEDQSDDVCMAAVSQDPHALRYVHNQTEAICLAAVGKHGWALYHVRDKTPKICMAAVRRDGMALRFVPPGRITPEMCREAVNKNGMALQYVPEDFKTPDICEIAVGKDRHAFQFASPLMKQSFKDRASFEASRFGTSRLGKNWTQKLPGEIVNFEKDPNGMLNPSLITSFVGGRSRKRKRRPRSYKR
jgi:hypothetical protein